MHLCGVAPQWLITDHKKVNMNFYRFNLNVSTFYTIRFVKSSVTAFTCLSVMGHMLFASDGSLLKMQPTIMFTEFLQEDTNNKIISRNARG